MAESPKTYRVRFLERIDRAPATASFRFAKPDGYRFAPGQHFVLGLETAEGPQRKYFTHADAPDDPWIETTTRLSGSAFKNALEALKPGDEVDVTGPSGKMVVPEGRPAIGFLVGGVGITPAVSILRDAVHRGVPLDAIVFYGNRDECNIPYAEEFREMGESRPDIRFVHVLERASDAWTGERGFITADVVRRHVDPLDGRTWIVAGPPVMIDVMTKVLDDLEVPKERRELERFAGY